MAAGVSGTATARRRWDRLRRIRGDWTSVRGHTPSPFASPTTTRSASSARSRTVRSRTSTSPLRRGVGKLTVAFEPRDAWIERDGQRLADATPVTLSDLPAGPVELTLGAVEHRTVQVRLEVPKDGVARLEAHARADSVRHADAGARTSGCHGDLAGHCTRLRAGHAPPAGRASCHGGKTRIPGNDTHRHGGGRYAPTDRTGAGAATVHGRDDPGTPRRWELPDLAEAYCEDNEHPVQRSPHCESIRAVETRGDGRRVRPIR